MPRPHRSLVLRLAATCALLVLVAIGATGVVHGATGERIGTIAGSGTVGFAGDEWTRDERAARRSLRRRAARRHERRWGLPDRRRRQPPHPPRGRRWRDHDGRRCRARRGRAGRVRGRRPAADRSRRAPEPAARRLPVRRRERWGLQRIPRRPDLGNNRIRRVRGGVIATVVTLADSFVSANL